MKIFLTALLCMFLCLPAFADQQTTVLFSPVNIKKATGFLPFIDGSNDPVLEKEANNILQKYAEELVDKVGNKGTINYAVQLNRPSLVSVLLQANNEKKVAYKGVNLDLTTGREFIVYDFFTKDEKVQETLGDYADVLFSEKGIYTRESERTGYTGFVPYSKLMASMRIGEAGRLVQIAKLTRNAEGKTLTVPNGSLLALKLDSNPTTGYRWIVTYPEGAENAIKNVGSSFIMPRGDDQRTGMPGVEILVFTAQEVGTYNLKFDYKRPWERLGSDSFNFTVVVKE